MAKNLRRMSSYCRQHNLDLRPHTKTHKTPELAQEQLGSGACGITVAKIGEAEVMSQEGLDDMLLAYPVFGASKAARLNALLEDASVPIRIPCSPDHVALCHEHPACRGGSGLIEPPPIRSR